MLKSNHETKVVFVCNELGTFRNHRENLARAVLPDASEVIVYAAPVGAEATRIEYEFRPIVIERFRFDAILDIRLFFVVLKMLLREQPRVLHLISIKPYLFGGLAAVIARWFGWKGQLVITVPGLGRLYDQDTRRPRRAALRRAIVQAFLRIATRHAMVTFETSHDRDVWLNKKLIAPSQAVVVNGAGLDFARFHPRSPVPSADRIKVLFAGRLLRQKGLDVYLKGASLLREGGHGDSVEMFVAGFIENDPDGVPVDELSRRKDLTFLGPVKDMAALLRDMDVVVLPSRYSEGIPRILIEAASCGCVSIATRFPGSEALIKDDETGIFLDGADRDTQAAQLVRLLTTLRDDVDRRTRIGANAAAFVRANGFGDQDVATTFVSLYALPHK